MNGHTYLSSTSLLAIDDLYRKFLEGDETLPSDWRRFFEGFQFAQATMESKAQHFCTHCLETEFRVMHLIEAYRQRGHFFTRTNPVRTRRKYSPTLDIEHFGLNDSHLEQEFRAGALIGIGRARLSAILEHLQQTYCASIGCEFTNIRFTEEVDWLKERIEPGRNRTLFRREEKLHLFSELAQAVLFEEFILRHFIGQKSFSLEGGEALIPALHLLFHYGAGLGAEDFQIGMAHRGRLNVLAHVLRKSITDIFSEFIGKYATSHDHFGDVKYHKGYSHGFQVDKGVNVYVNLAPNPSHLEAVASVVEGMSKARLVHRHRENRDKIIPIVIHGDAAASAQGIVYEVVQMAGLPAYETGGTIHLVINNQIGFTTNYLEGRTSVYCTDVAKVTTSPVFHVNADDLEAVIHVIRLAVEYRQKFHRDVFIDLLGYRRRGHNETDEPKYTQPLLYKAIENHPNLLAIYREQLIAEKAATAEELDGITRGIQEHMKAALAQAKDKNPSPALAPVPEEWKGLREPELEDFLSSPETGVDPATLEEVARALSTLPDGFPVFDKTRKVLETRRESFFQRASVDWALSELLAFGSFLKEGVGVRFTGQDAERGTFSQRHAVVLREDSEERYVPLNALRSDTARFDIHNSLLSEFGVLGFELGYSMAQPKGITIWEAQFGDFANSAQVIIDNFLVSSRTKWAKMSGIILLLPHGYEGQGAEHSSARLERFLQLCACLNMQVVQPTTPANYFHALRRQIHRPFRLPLVVMTPKSLLRHPQCVSDVSLFHRGCFQEILDDGAAEERKIRKVLFCSGKIYYELKAARDKQGKEEIALLRLEQLYPLPEHQIHRLAGKYYRACGNWVWVQEEPRNMGAYYYLKGHLSGIPFQVISRHEADTPATGYFERHVQEQNQIISKALEI